VIPKIVMGQNVLECKNVQPKRRYVHSTSTEREPDGRSMWNVSGGRHIQGFGGEKLKERGLLEGPSVDGRIILKSILKDREFDSCG